MQAIAEHGSTPASPIASPIHWRTLTHSPNQERRGRHQRHRADDQSRDADFRTPLHAEMTPPNDSASDNTPTTALAPQRASQPRSAREECEQRKRQAAPRRYGGKQVERGSVRERELAAM
jgi:hypothetical protein